MSEKLKAPFPYFGGKSRVSSLVWERFGDTKNYCEPFFGSGAVLLGRPHRAQIETVNDADALLCNFWRAISADPAAVAHFADWPVNETDLFSRHTWIVNEGAKHVEKCKADPDYYDAKIADCRENAGMEVGVADLVDGEKVIEIVLTIAHLDRTSANQAEHGPIDCPDERLAALCQRCHNTLDAPMRGANRAANRRNKGAGLEL